MDAVNRVLNDLELSKVPRLVVMNKADRVDPAIMEGLCRRYEAVAVSALKRQGLGTLIATAENRIHVDNGDSVSALRARLPQI